MLEKDRSSWEFGFWSSLTLEMLIRASLANISPVLVADRRDWNNTLYAIGIAPNQQKFISKSANISELLKLSENVFSKFTREMLSFSITHIQRRNSELHSGELPFENLDSSKWLPMFYSICGVLVTEIGESLETLFGKEMAVEINALIHALKDESAKSVRSLIQAHKTIWDEKSAEERIKLSKQAETLSTRQHGHRVECPSCNSIALIYGVSTGPPTTIINDDSIVEKQTMLPSSFKCIACGLKILGYSKLAACNLGDTYVSTSYYDAIDYFGIDIEEEFRSMMHEDYNE